MLETLKLKKILRSLDSIYTAYLLRFNKETKSYFLIKIIEVLFQMKK